MVIPLNRWVIKVIKTPRVFQRLYALLGDLAGAPCPPLTDEHISISMDELAMALAPDLPCTL